MFRPSDIRRVQAAFDDELPVPYEAAVILTNNRMTMTVAITDPDDPDLPVGQAVWWFDEKRKSSQKQPTPQEVSEIAASLATVCTDYPARKAAEAVERAERRARKAANIAARQADAKREAKLEAVRRGEDPDEV